MTRMNKGRKQFHFDRTPRRGDSESNLTKWPKHTCGYSTCDVQMWPADHLRSDVVDIFHIHCT